MLKGPSDLSVSGSQPVSGSQKESVNDVNSAEAGVSNAVEGLVPKQTSNNSPPIEGKARFPFMSMVKSGFQTLAKVFLTMQNMFSTAYSSKAEGRTSDSNSAIESMDSSSSVSNTNEAIKDLQTQFKDKINKYSVGDFKTDTEMQAELTTYLDSNAVAVLNQGCVKSTAAREKFINFLLDQPISQAPSIDKPPIPMSKLIGKEGVKLYKAALAEEHNSAEFRTAVYLKSSSKRGDVEAPKAQVILVVGPSASGKSSGIEAVTKTIFPETEGAKEGKNKLTAVDGAIERELSHTSHLLLSFANSQGHQGVVGLHPSERDKEVKSIKKCVREAIETNTKKDISIIMPETYSEHGVAGRIGLQSLDKGRLKMGKVGNLIKFASETKRGIVLIGIVGEQPNDFKNAVAVMGNKRAWATKGSETSQISPNAKLSCESKQYGAAGFEFGVKGSGAATEAFKEEVTRYNELDARQFTITNDLVAYKPNGQNWEKMQNVSDAKANSNDAALISSSLFNVWKNLPEVGKNYEEHKISFQGFHDKNDLNGFSTYCRKNGISGVQMKEETIPRKSSPLKTT